MSGHSRWWMYRPEKMMASETMSQHVQGYILAVEDILKDLEYFRHEMESDAAIIEALEMSATQSRANALRTLEVITKKMDAAE